jgi:hypothetical protein
LNHILELAGVAYGPHPTPVSVEALKKRKADSIEKTTSKHLKAREKKKAEPGKVSVAAKKAGVKRPSDTDVALMKLAKLSKQIIPHALASVATTRATLGTTGLKKTPARGTSGCKTARGTRGSKFAGGASGSKPVGSASSLKVVVSKTVPKTTAITKRATAPRKMRHVPMVGGLAVISSESSPHGQAVQSSGPKIPLRLEARNPSPMATV